MGGEKRGKTAIGKNSKRENMSLDKFGGVEKSE